MARRHVINVHPRRAHVHESDAIGARIAEAVTHAMGSLTFIVAQTVIIVIWIAANLWLLGRHPFDPAPFILLNLLFSTQAAYASPLILLAQNRQAERDRKRDDAEAKEVEDDLALTQDIHGLSKEIHAMVTTQHKILAILDPTSGPGERDERISRGAAGRAGPDDDEGEE